MKENRLISAETTKIVRTELARTMCISLEHLTILYDLQGQSDYPVS